MYKEYIDTCKETDLSKEFYDESQIEIAKTVPAQIVKMFFPDFEKFKTIVREIYKKYADEQEFRIYHERNYIWESFEERIIDEIISNGAEW